MAQEGAAEETYGSIERPPFYAVYLLRDGFVLADFIDGESGVTDDQLQFLRDQSGAIITERADGNFRTRYYKSDDELTDAWDDVVGTEPEVDEMDDFEDNSDEE
jgi:hypothetical protein